MPKSDGLGFVSRNYADLFRELHGPLANKDPVELKPPYRVSRAAPAELEERLHPVGVLVIKMRMPGERFSIEAVAASEWMKWSIVEALTETFVKLLKVKIRSDAILFCSDEIEIMDVQMPYMGDKLWQFCEFRFDYKVRLTSEPDIAQAVTGALERMADFEACFCQTLELKFREVYHLTVLGLLNKRHILMDGRPISDQIALFKAAASNDEAGIARLVEQGTDVDATLKESRYPAQLLDEDERFVLLTLERTALLAAAEEGHLEAIRLLVNAKADIEYQDTSGFHALYLAAGAASAQQAVAFLLLSGADVNLRNKSGYTPLHNACGCGETSSIRALIEAKGDLNIRSQIGAAPVHVAVINNQPGSLEALKSLRANLDMPAFGGNTPVHEGVMQNNPDIIQTLFDLKADINIESGPENGYATPLKMAVERKKKKAAKKLRDLGAIEQVGGDDTSAGEYEPSGEGEYRLRRKPRQP
eukprot:TRINITY_DN30995_c0_g1_i1.p1 TRINITY_DN30995_c0_g1~~TRINITY_DN30995_c0_g1_i1.p1  ORF type:complete len:485 (-),score=125.63 TRINITY_DN30995_c0_g1_i1:51-1472(-)